MRKFILPLVLLVFGMSSCTFEQDIHINTDRTGSMTYVMDMSGAKDLMGSMGEAEEDSTAESEDLSLLSSPEMQNALEEMRQMEGVSNLKVEEDAKKGIYSFGFDFTDPNVLNNQSSNPGNMMMGGSGEGVPDDFKYFTFKGKKLIYKIPTEALEELKNSEEMGGLGSSAEMMEMFRYKVRLSFDNEIKAVKGNDEVVIAEDRKSVTYESDFGKIINGESAPNMTIIFKKKL